MAVACCTRSLVVLLGSYRTGLSRWRRRIGGWFRRIAKGELLWYRSSDFVRAFLVRDIFHIAIAKRLVALGRVRLT